MKRSQVINSLLHISGKAGADGKEAGMESSGFHRAEGSPAPFTYLKLRDLGLCGLRQDFRLSFDETFLKSHKEDAGYSLQDQSKHPKSSQGRE